MTNYELTKRFKKKYFLTIAWRLNAHSKVLNEILQEDEEVNYLFAGQRENLLGATAIVAITNKRILMVTARIFGDSFIHDLSNSKIESEYGFIWAKIIFTTDNDKFTLSYIDKDAISEIDMYLKF